MGSSSSSPAKGADELVAAALGGDLVTLQHLLDGGSSYTAQDASGNHALGAACCGGHIDVASEVLSRAEADDMLAPVLELRNGIGTTPLWLAAGYGHAELVARLIERSAVVDAPNSTGDSPLLAAVSRGHGEVVTALLGAGADPLTPNRAGDTPLLIAAGRSDLPMATVLLDAVAEAQRPQMLTATNAKKVSPLGAAASASNAELVSLLCERADSATLAAMKTAQDANGATPLAVAAFCKADAVVARLLLPDAGGALSIADSDGNTPLWLAAASGSVGAVRELLNAGAAPGSASVGKPSALEAARANGNEECARLLSQHDDDGRQQ